VKETRHIVKPIKGLWSPKGSVWAKKNDDDELGNGKEFKFGETPLSSTERYLMSGSEEDREAMIKEQRERKIKRK